MSPIAVFLARDSDTKQCIGRMWCGWEILGTVHLGRKLCALKNSRPHIRCEGHMPCSLSWRLLVLAFSSHVPSDQSDVLESDTDARGDSRL